MCCLDTLTRVCMQLPPEQVPLPSYCPPGILNDNMQACLIHQITGGSGGRSLQRCRVAVMSLAPLDNRPEWPDNCGRLGCIEGTCSYWDVGMGRWACKCHVVFGFRRCHIHTRPNSIETPVHHAPRGPSCICASSHSMGGTLGIECLPSAFGRCIWGRHLREIAAA
jgi:hypothetical protein